MSDKDDKKKETKKEVTPRVQQSSKGSLLNSMKKVFGLAPKKKSVESVSESTSSPLNSNPSTTLPPPDFSNTLARAC